MQLVSKTVNGVDLRFPGGVAAGGEDPAARLQEAQRAYGEAVRLLAAGQYADALAQVERSLALKVAIHGESHLETVPSLSLLGRLSHLLGDYAGAEPLLQRGLEIRQAASDSTGHPEIAELFNSLAHLYTDQGRYDCAEPLYQTALAIREVALGPGHPSVAESLNGQARLLTRQGLYGHAEPLYARALALREAALGAGHPDVAQTLNNLGNLYREQCLHGRAQPLYERALAIREAALGASHPLVATSLNNLATLYREQGLYSQAQSLHERALAIYDAALGAAHPDVARTLTLLASLYAVQGEGSHVEALCEQALTMLEAALGPEHPDIAYSLYNLAGFYLAQGRYERAEPLYERALALREAALGTEHPLVAEALGNLALLRVAQQRLADALPLCWRALSLSEQRLRREALDFSNTRLANFLQLLRTGEERLYTLLRAHPDDPGAQRLALTAALLFKGRSAAEAASTSRAVYQALGTQDRRTFEKLRELRTQLSSLAVQGPGSLPHAEYQRNLKELAEEGDLLEADLVRRSAPLRAMTALPSPADIIHRAAAALPRDGALVELIAYQDRPLQARSGPWEPLPSAQLRYLALMLFPDASMRALDLGPAGPIDELASRLRGALAIRDASYQALAQELYEAVFQPLVPLLGGARRIYLSTDGQLSLVPFAALHDGHQFLIDSFEFTYLTSGRELLPRTEDTAPSSSVVVLADPDFSAALQSEPPADVSVDVVERPWVPLPGTRQEAEAIQRLIPQAQLFLGPEAHKPRLLSLSAPGVLHLATHGFFLDDSPTPKGSRAVGHFGVLGQKPAAPRPSDPLLCSGLVLAGACAPSADDPSGSELLPESAVVTALELSGLNLWGTQLVVLSACDTGRGEVKLGQGVYGLRRAFVTAGAETVVTSLWKVNDETTRALMEAYYRHLLQGQGRGSALHEAMRLMRQSDSHPHYWAPFIVVGRDAPLRGLGGEVLQ